MRPIVAQSGSPLSPAARFVDHTLQPLAQSHKDYIKHSTTLIHRLENIHVPETSVLVTIDVESLYPSIPQSECLQVLNDEMQKKETPIKDKPELNHPVTTCLCQLQLFSVFKHFLPTNPKNIWEPLFLRP